MRLWSDGQKSASRPDMIKKGTKIPVAGAGAAATGAARAGPFTEVETVAPPLLAPRKQDRHQGRTSSLKDSILLTNSACGSP